MRKKPYPRGNDIADAILKAISRNPLVKPEEFVDEVLRVLEEEGFYTGLVTPKRVWRIYEKMVKSGKMFDYLMVVERGEG